MMAIHPELTRVSMAKPPLQNGRTKPYSLSFRIQNCRQCLFVAGRISSKTEDATHSNASNSKQKLHCRQSEKFKNFNISIWHFNVYSETRCSGVLFAFAALHKGFPPSKLGPVTRLPP
ncbi:hypothetical protein V6N12_049423 [Hibiscus sabdariffa]|uniref:Uncharacterized protein n=1 Tax=Hibiscus sabdariffa TaxID=183260 RepID=A0ABR2CBP3_9ROSI